MTIKESDMGQVIGESKLSGRPDKHVYPITKTKFVLEGSETQEQINKRLWDAFYQQIKTSGTTTIGTDGYWYVNGVKTDIKAQGEKGADGKTPLLRVSVDGMSIEVSTDGGETWITFVQDFNQLRVIGYVNSRAQLPLNATIGSIYGVWESKPTEEDPEAGVYRLYIQTVKEWKLDKEITKVYDYDTELPSSATDGTTVIIPENGLTLDKEKVDGYKVYEFSSSNNGWIMVLNTAEIYASEENIINYGDNVYALVKGNAEGTYELYKRQTGWIYFGTNASITYHLIQDINEGTSTNVTSGEAVKRAINEEAAIRNSAINAEKDRAQEVENTLSERITNEEQARESAITTETEARTAAIATETSARTEAINAEVTAREQAINSLQSAINAEQQTQNDLLDNHETRLDALEQNTVTLTLTVSPQKTFEKGVTPERKTLTASVGKLTPTKLDIKWGTRKLNSNDEASVEITDALNESQTVFTAYAEYYDAKFNTSLTVQARYPIYYGFGDNAAAVAQAYETSRIVATSAARTYTRTSESAGHFFIIVPPDVPALNGFTMGSAPFVMAESTTTINNIDGYRVYKSGVEYATNTTLSVAASN